MIFQTQIFRCNHLVLSLQLPIVLLMAAVAVSGAPQSYNQRSGNTRFIPIVSYNRNGPLNGVYDFDYESADGTRRQEQGAPNGPKGAVTSQGGWSFTFPDGSPGKFSFVADEGGYRVESPLLPTPPPMPAHALQQIAFARQQRAGGRNNYN